MHQTYKSLTLGNPDMPKSAASLLLQKSAPTILVILFLNLTSGCSSTGNQVYHCCVGQSVNGDQNGVQISNVWTAGDALPLATNHCQEYGKIPQFERMSLITAHYKCVVPKERR